MTDKTNLRAFALFAIIGVLCIIAAACATVKHDLNTMSGAFATCERADLGAEVNTAGTTLLADVAAIIIGDAATLEADLTALAAKAGLESVQCAIAAVEAVTEAKPAASGAVSASLPLPGAARADVWSRSQRAAVAK